MYILKKLYLYDFLGKDTENDFFEDVKEKIEHTCRDYVPTKEVEEN